MKSVSWKKALKVQVVMDTIACMWHVLGMDGMLLADHIIEPSSSRLMWPLLLLS